jgi:hypothetical protein
MGSDLPVKQQQFLLAIPFFWPQRSDLNRKAILPALISSKPLDRQLQRPRASTIRLLESDDHKKGNINRAQ